MGSGAQKSQGPFAAGVIGHPIRHSLSPALFSFLSQKLKRDLDYKTMDVDPQSLQSAIETSLKNKNFLGMNVTIPHKEQVILLADKLNWELSKEARDIGAANVLQFKDGKVLVYNTDVIGVLKTFDVNKVRIAGKNAMIVGAGGGALAVAHAMGQRGARSILVVSRNNGRSQTLCSHMKTLFPKTEFKVLGQDELKKELAVDLVVNATPIGMQGVSTSFERTMAPFLANVNALNAFDLIYRPLETPFLEFFRLRGTKCFGGLNMLIFQAIATWEIWFGLSEDENQLALELDEHLSYILQAEMAAPKEQVVQDASLDLPKNIYLTGFMGVGKSTVGSLLAQDLGWKLVDTDQLIEKSEGASIGEIFERNGESKFRNLEKKVVEQVSRSKNQVISLGGGTILDEQSRKIILESGCLIYLSADPKSLLERLSEAHKSRPLLKSLDADQRTAKIQSLLAARTPFYEMSHKTIETDGLTPQAVTIKILETLQK